MASGAVGECRLSQGRPFFRSQSKTALLPKTEARLHKHTKSEGLFLTSGKTQAESPSFIFLSSFFSTSVNMPECTGEKMCLEGLFLVNLGHTSADLISLAAIRCGRYVAS